MRLARRKLGIYSEEKMKVTKADGHDGKPGDKLSRTYLRNFAFHLNL